MSLKFNHDGAKAISIKNHIANYTGNKLSMPTWQRKGQKVWEGDYKSELIESVMSGIMIPILYLGNIIHQTKPYIIDGGHRTRALHAYVQNMYAWERGTERLYYSEVPKITRGSRIMTEEERHEFDTYKLTIVSYRDITENQARIIFNRLQNAAPMAMSAEPPTIALLGKIPKGGKNACIDPPNPRLKPFSRPKISANAP